MDMGLVGARMSQVFTVSSKPLVVNCLSEIRVAMLDIPEPDAWALSISYNSKVTNLGLFILQ